MYSYDDRIRAVKLCIKYDFGIADTIRKLGYLSSKILVRWHKEYRETGGLYKHHKRRSKYTLEQMETAVN